MKIESDIVDIANSAENVFTYLSNFTNFKVMMPDQVTDWKATENECSFTIKGMATIGMIIIKRIPHSFIEISSNGSVPFEFKLEVHITAVAEKTCKGQLIFNADLNPMMKMMVSKPLGNFFNVLAHKMKDIK